MILYFSSISSGCLLFRHFYWKTLNDVFDEFPLNFQDREKYKLENPRSYHYLNQSDYYELDGVNDAHEYLATRRAMDIVGISEEEQVCP